MSKVFTERLGIIGFGQVGQAITSALSQSFDLTIYDRDLARCEAHPLAQSDAIKVAISPQDMASRVDILLFCLPTPEISLAVAAEIAPSMREGQLLLETSTVAPEHVEALHGALSPHGVRVVDTALIGGIHALTNGQAVMLIGETEDASARFEPVLAALTAERFYFGGRGRGMKAKLIANAVSHAVYVVLAEATALSTAQDLPMSVMYRLLARESGMIRPLTHRIGERLLRNDFTGGMSTANARKDSRLIVEMAHQLNIPLFAMTAAHSVYEIAAREGMAAQDYAVVGKLWEKWADIEIPVEGKA
ncbi:NAD(P)-binding domain-containing protein [Paracoccus sp. (in: a-proteobacteria)]|uniref:NAD(P)-dependent oxidoreductase n=1 Tax=Paracoccus sp. TaxID=267 RepID=UPI0028A84E24|nr:NAD(P)-binding domain-containing protein [Paracoccus sp. (in: a-proteobacteria)]